MALNVLFFPPWGDGDYQEFLYSSLEEYDVQSTEASNHMLYPVLKNIQQIRKVDIFHIHWIYVLYGGGSVWMPLFMPILCVQMLILRLIGTPIVWTVHNRSTHDTPYPRLDLVIRRLFARFICDQLIVHCQTAKKEIIEAYDIQAANKVHVIPHGNFESYPQNTDQDLEIETSADAYCYLHFGSLKPYKGTIKLINTFSSIAKEEDRLLIVGRPTNEKFKRKIISAVDDDRIYYRFEFIEREKFAALANQADAMVLPYDNILTSGVVHLALTFNLPVVAPQKGCIPEVVPSEAGVIYPQDGLEKAMQDVKELNKKTIRASAEKTTAGRDWDGISKETLAVYKRSLK
jgi:glycosyltransferase involved in cell wall biosynthesis